MRICDGTLIENGNFNYFVKAIGTTFPLRIAACHLCSVLAYLFLWLMLAYQVRLFKNIAALLCRHQSAIHCSMCKNWVDTFSTITPLLKLPASYDKWLGGFFWVLQLQTSWQEGCSFSITVVKFIFYHGQIVNSCVP